ncbi:MarR family winged helix-turn-helix transcriptional regulator [Variovorax sp. HJSM1_2]|uniref:MarR family winged helix-turn-helix transcriptional regulator n=1 Tax=Variovorax sp. HJSM1_2 TaxID=3366263 RepID=UPI003BD3CF65
MNTALTTRAARKRSGADWRTDDLALARTLELVFFAHMEMADAADKVLVQHGLSRPHHRVLSFAQIKPGLSVGELLYGLRISNQALSRTMQKIVALGLIEQRYAETDRRVRHHFLTEQGYALLAVLRARQYEVIRKAHLVLPQADLDAFWRMLETLSRPEDLAMVSPHPGRPPASRQKEQK